MGTVSNPARERVEVHFRSFTEFSCGDTIGKPQSDDPAVVTCMTCLTEWLRLTESRYAGGEGR